MLDAGIAFLQRLRTKTGGEPEQVEDAKERRGASTHPIETSVEAPNPKRRLRALLIHLSVLLAGGIGGSALAYTLFQQQLDRVLNASQHQEATHSKKTQPRAEIQKVLDNEQTQRADAEKKRAASLAAHSTSTSGTHHPVESVLGEQAAANRRLETALADATQSRANAQKSLAEEQVKRTIAEEKLAESSKALADKQKQLDAVEKKLTVLNSVEALPGARRDLQASRTRNGRGNRPLKTGDCTLSANNIDALKSCIADFNR